MIRNIKKSDYPAVDNLLLQLHKIHLCGRPELFADLEHFISQDSFEALLNDTETIALLATQNFKIVGCCFASISNHSVMAKMKIVSIDQLVVDEKYRCQGIGRKLFEATKQRAKTLGAKRIDLTVWNHNQTAIHAYESYGMKPQLHTYELLL